MTFYTAAITLILVMDPLGNIPIFLSILGKYDPKTQTRIIIRETLIAFIILIIFLFFGKYILRGLHITTYALSMAGGIILFLIALKLIFPKDYESEKGTSREEEPFIVPLAIPLTAGPSAIATVLLFVTSQPDQLLNWFIAVVIATVFFLLIMLSSRVLMRLLGKRGLIAVERLMGMILTTVAVQMFLSGITQYFQHANFQ